MKLSAFIFCSLLFLQTFASSGSVTPACTCHSDRIVSQNSYCFLNENESCKTNDGVIRNGWTYARCGKVNCPAFLVVGGSSITVERRSTDCSAANRCNNGEGRCSSWKHCEAGTHCMLRSQYPDALGYDISGVGEQMNFCGRDYVYSPTKAPTARTAALNVADNTTTSSKTPAWTIALIVIGSIGCLAILACAGYRTFVHSKFDVEIMETVDDVPRESIQIDDLPRESMTDI